MILSLSLVETTAFFAAGILVATLAIRFLFRWRHAVAVGRARRVAERLRVPATTLATVEDQSAALQELCQLADVPAAVTVARELLAEPDATVRSAAVEALRRLRAFDLWVRDLQQGNYRAKLRAIEALGEIGDERAVDVLIEALGDDDPDIARAASRAVVARDPDYASERLAEALASPRRRVAETAAATLVQMGEEGVEALIGNLTDLNARSRQLTVECLGAIGGENLASALLPMLHTDPAAEVRVAVADALCRIGGEAVNGHLQRLARSDPDWFVRSRAVSLVAETGGPEATDFLLEMLAAIQPEVRRETADQEDVEVVTEGVKRIQSAITAGLRLLGVDGENRAAALRVEAPETEEDGREEEEDWIGAAVGLRDGDAMRRAESARRLGEAGPRAALRLRSALKDPEPLVRSEAARALGRVGGRENIAALAACLNDPNAEVRLAVTNAMRGIVMREVARELPTGESEGEVD